MDELEPTAADEDFGPGHVLDEKRRTRSTYRRGVGSDPTSFTVVLSEPAIGNLRAADVDRGSWTTGPWEPWNERVRAYLHALFGRARLREYPDAYDRVVGKR